MLAAAVLAGFPPAVLADQPGPVVARVNGAPLVRLAVQSEIERLLPAASYHGRVARDAWERLVDRAIENAILAELAYQEAAKRGIEIDEDLIDQREKASIDRAGSEDAFEDALEARGLSREDFRRQARKALLADELYEQVMADIQRRVRITDADLEKYYEDNPEKFVIPASVDVRHLLLRVPPWGGKEQWERTERRAAWIAKRARKGEDFEALVRTYSDDESSKEAGGKLVSVHGGKYAEAIKTISEGLEPGEVGGPARSLYGYHIVKLLKRHTARQLAFKDLDREQLREELRRKTVRERFEAWRDGLREDAKVVLVKKQVDLLRSPPPP